MMPSRPIKGGFEKFDLLDEAISQFRKFATEKQVNVILVIHPKKEDDKIALGLSSIFGSAKATQEVLAYTDLIIFLIYFPCLQADIVLILQRLEARAYLDVKKNRYDGDLGRLYLDYSQITSSFYEVDGKDIEAAAKKKY